MARTPSKAPSVADAVLETPDSSVLDLLDRLLNKGVTATGDVTLGVAGIDLIYLRLSTLLCAADRVMPVEFSAGRRRVRRRRPATFKRSS
jgi:Gas vesicle protein